MPTTRTMQGREAGGNAASAGAAIGPLWLVAATGVALVAGAILRCWLWADAPLWLDEVFTGAIAAQPDWRSTLAQIRMDVVPPAYSAIAHAWAGLFGLSNAALRAPALVFALLAPLACLIPAAAVAPRTRLVWCGLMALWIPAFRYAQEARGYSLVLLMATLATVAFLRVLEAPTLRRMLAWTACLGLGAFAHYHLLILGALQGLVVLAWHGWRALRCWPAAGLLLPVLGWILANQERIAAFSDPAAAWYPLVGPLELVKALHFVLGRFELAAALLLLAAIVALMGRLRPRAESPDGSGQAALAAALASLLGAGLVVGLGVWRPSFTVRYLMPFEPGLLLGLALLFERLGRQWRGAPVALLALFGAAAALDSTQDRSLQKGYSFERASADLMAAGTRQVAFLLDHPAAPVMDPAQLAAVGGFFFRRAGVPVTVIALVIPAGTDPRPALRSAVGEPGSASLWLYDTDVHGTAARLFPPDLGVEPRRLCRNEAPSPFGVVSCRRPVPGPS